MFNPVVPFWLLLPVFPSSAFLPHPPASKPPRVLARQQVCHDRNEHSSFYCGCQWQWTGRSGGRIDHGSCGYQTAPNPTAERIGWEHIVPASVRSAASAGSKADATTNSDRVQCPTNLHNLTPAVGEINADRSNFRFGMLPGTGYRHGQCDFKVEFSERTVEPRDEVKGKIARVWFYMHDHYDLRMSNAQQRLLMAWDRQFPPSAWERERDRRISRLMGHANPFVTGERQWTLNHRNSRAGLQSSLPAQAARSTSGAGRIKGNQRSKVYHLPQGCPGYSQMSDSNVRWFDSEAEAVAQGYRKAGNCR